jgi:hypothetical protein
MFGRFFAFEMGCPEHDAQDPTLDQLQTQNSEVFTLDELMAQEAVASAEENGQMMICECKGLGCNKCKRKKAKIITLTGRGAAPVPVMNMPPSRMPLAPWTLDMVMMTKQQF